jgi:hypothetical protein
MAEFTQPMTQTKLRGSHSAEYEIFLTFADNGEGLDITNNLQPLPTFDEWLAR